jgi:hypothetical protein
VSTKAEAFQTDDSPLLFLNCRMVSSSHVHKYIQQLRPFHITKFSPFPTVLVILLRIELLDKQEIEHSIAQERKVSGPTINNKETKKACSSTRSCSNLTSLGTGLVENSETTLPATNGISALDDITCTAIATPILNSSDNRNGCCGCHTAWGAWGAHDYS